MTYYTCTVPKSNFRVCLLTKLGVNVYVMPPTGGKKPFQQAMPEPALEPIQDGAIVVIHPGSRNLRLGRAADTFPHVIPHCIARRHKQPGKQTQYEDPYLLRPKDQHSQAQTFQEWGLKHATQFLANKTTSRGHLREPTVEEQLRQINRSVKPSSTDILSPYRWTDTMIKRDYLIGDDALYVSPTDHYSLHWPLRQGSFNLHSGEGGTVSAVLQDLETIWSYAIQNFLGIPLKDLKHYRAVLMVSDIYRRQQVREMMTLVLNKIGFSAAIVVQESVCATFGAGVSSACVVDVGDQKTAISCVEDGLSQRKSRLLLEYGGRDITRCLHWLLRRAGFPYRECNPGDRIDAMFLEKLKENHCHLNKDIFGTDEQQIKFGHPRCKMCQCMLHMGDERILAPLSLFYPNMLGMIGSNVCKNMDRYRSDPGDPLDEDYLMQTMSKHEQAARLVALRKKESATALENLSQNDSNMLDESQLDDDDTMDPTEGANTEMQSAGGISKLVRKMEEEEEGVDISEGLMGLDEAICRSVDRCEGEEMKRRMYSCILLVGGGLKFRGVEDWLGELILSEMPAHIPMSLETHNIVLQQKDIDPQVTCWKGAAILCCLDTAQELWIRQGEWTKYGVRVLRERAPFIW